MNRFASALRFIHAAQRQHVLNRNKIIQCLPQGFMATGLAHSPSSRYLSCTPEDHEATRRDFLAETHASARHKRSGQDKASLVIFDKDGTLICFHAMWSSWAVQVTESIARLVGLSIQDKLYQTLGVCAKSKRVFPGLLAEKTSSVIQEELVKLLVSEGVSRDKALEAVVESWRDGDSGQGKGVESIHPDLRTLFKILKAEGIKVAVCTADNRRGTMNTLRHLGLTSYIDMVVCGDDPFTQPKPSPHNAWKICGALDIDPEKAVMVGDTKADVGMGHAAKLGWVVGVLSGVGDSRDLQPEANYIIDNVKDLLPLILPYKDWVNYYTYKSDERVLKEPAELHAGESTAEKYGIDMNSFNVVIFELHGTLICTADKYETWLEKFICRLESKTNLSLAARISDLFSVSKKIERGIFNTDAQAHLKEELVKLLRNEGFHFEEAVITVNQSWKDCESILKSASTISADGEAQTLFRTLKENGVKIAICTSATREVAVQDLKTVGLTSYIDMMICGDDPMFRHKPEPHNALLVCEEMGTTPNKAVIVGDTMEDINMGLNAKVGLTIGVLTGLGSRSELVQADHIVSSVKEILLHLRPRDERQGSDNITNGSQTPDSKTAKHSAASAPQSFPPHTRSFFTWSRLRAHQLSSQGSTTGTLVPPLQKASYNYIIIGAGSAGCVLANRLTEDGQSSVLVIEAGPKDNTWKIHMPAALMYNLCDDRYNWYYHTDPEPGMNNRIMYQPRGRVWGGSSSLNAMVYIRGHALDYDRWEKEGATSWSYANCLPYFKKSQTHELGPNEYRGGDGPLKVSRGKTNHPLHQAFIEAGVQAGYPFTDDMNGHQQEGFGWMDMTIHCGQRWSTSDAYLRPATARVNLDTITKALVTRVLFSGRRATGVEFEHAGWKQSVYAEKEVILSGGTFNSPQLLQLSGIGDGNLLKSLDIPVVQHLPGVGMNLQDHLEIYVQQACKKPITLYSASWKYPQNMIRIGLEWFMYQTGYGATAHLESGAFIRSRGGIVHPDIQYHFLPSTVNDHGRKPGPCHAYQVHVGPMRPTSRGSVKIRSNDPKQHPQIIFNYLSTPEDLKEFRDGIKLTREIFAQKAFDDFRGSEMAPGKHIKSDQDLDSFARQMGDTAYHPSCSCKMGSPNDPMAVVDPSCRVIGVEGLRVVDASIMPSVVSGNLNGPTVMMAEKAADIIRGVPPLPKSNAPVWLPPDPSKQR